MRIFNHVIPYFWFHCFGKCAHLAATVLPGRGRAARAVASVESVRTLIRASRRLRRFVEAVFDCKQIREDGSASDEFLINKEFITMLDYCVLTSLSAKSS